jgi:hypothetical protein
MCQRGKFFIGKLILLGRSIHFLGRPIFSSRGRFSEEVELYFCWSPFPFLGPSSLLLREVEFASRSEFTHCWPNFLLLWAEFLLVGRVSSAGTKFSE